MNHEEVGRYWDGLNTPAFLEMLPDMSSLSGLDVGCGEGHNTRLLAQPGARMTAIDISKTFIHHAGEAERKQPLGIRYQIASAVDLPFDEASFDYATAFMSLMDIPETGRVFAEVFRVLRPGGSFQFSITHPCFDTPHRKNVRDEGGRTYAIEVGDYYRGQRGEVEEWIFSAAPPEVRDGLRPFRMPRFTRTLSEWLNLLVETGFMLKRFGEPYPDDEAVRERPGLQDAQVVAYYFHVRARKPV